MKLLKVVVIPIYCILISTLFLGCKHESKSIDVDLVLTTEAERFEEETPPDLMDQALSKVLSEMRVFDVNAHHDVIQDLIQLAVENESEAEIKAIIKEKVREHMDAYFYTRIGEILENYNPNYAQSDVETLFNKTSRTALYELIELYEWTFYKNNK